MNELPPDLIAGLAALGPGGGGSPQDAQPVVEAPRTVPQQAPPSLTDLYVRARQEGLDDTNAALAVARHLRDVADTRSTFREAGDVAAGRDPALALAYRGQLMNEAENPLRDLAQRRMAGPLAFEEAKRRGELASADIGAQQAAQLRDPNHPTNVAMRQAFSRMGLTPPSGLTVAALPKEMWETVKPLAELAGKREEITAGAPLKAAEAAKARAEAGKVGATTGPEVAKTSAEAAKAAAEGAVEAQKLGGQVAPGFVRTGAVANVGDKEIQEFRTQATAADDTQRYTKELLGLLGGKDYVLDPKKRAKAAIVSGKLLASMKSAMGIRGLPAQDVQYLESLTGNLKAGNISNLLGLTKNPVRLKELATQTQAELDSRAKTLGLARAGVAETPTHYLVSPDGKTRIAADASGKPLPGAQPEPNPKAAKVPNA